MNIKIDQLEKSYKKKKALYPLSLSLNTGIYGLLGPNGAGKSTLMNILATVEKPTHGKVMVDNQEIWQIEKIYKSKLGYLPQTFGMMPELTGREFLMYIASLKGISSKEAANNIQSLLQQVNLTEVADNALHSYSGGMKQRIGICQALLNRPSFLLLDEPTVGLDPDERIHFKHLILKQAEHSTVLLSTHIVSDVEALATHIIVMKHGRVLATGKVNELKQAVKGMIWRVPNKSHSSLSYPHIIGSNHMNNDGFEETKVISFVSPSPQAIPVEATLEDVYLYNIHKDKLSTDNSNLINNLNGQDGWIG